MLVSKISYPKKIIRWSYFLSDNSVKEKVNLCQVLSVEKGRRKVIRVWRYNNRYNTIDQ